MPIITRFGGSGGGTPVVDPYPHVWECTVVQSGTTGVVSGVVTLETYDILHYTMPLGFSTYDLMIGGVVYTTTFRNEGEMYIQWDGNDFVLVDANASCTLPHVWTSPTYTITGSVLTITGGVDDLHTNDVIELTLSSGESASNIEYNSTIYTIDTTIDDSQTNYVMFNGTSFELLNPKFNFIGDATVSDVLSGKTFYGNSDTLLTGTLVPSALSTKDYFYALPNTTNSTYTVDTGISDANATNSIVIICTGVANNPHHVYIAYNGQIVNTRGSSQITSVQLVNGILTIGNGGRIYDVMVIRLNDFTKFDIGSFNTSANSYEGSVTLSNVYTKPNLLFFNGGVTNSTMLVAFIYINTLRWRHSATLLTGQSTGIYFVYE